MELGNLPEGNQKLPEQDKLKMPFDFKEFGIVNLCMIAGIAVASFVGLAVLIYMMLLPACFAYIYTRGGIKYVCISGIVALVFSSLFMMSINVLPVLLALPAGIYMGFALRKRKSMLYTVSVCAIGFILSFTALSVINYMSADSNTNLSGMITATVNETVSRAAEVYSISSSDIGALTEIFMEIFPSAALLFVAIMSYFTFVITRGVLSRRESGFDQYKPFKMISADRVSAVIFIALFISSTFTSGIVAQVLANVLILIASFMMVCGLSLTCWFIDRVRTPGGRIALNIAAVLFMPVLMYAYMFAGFVDAWFCIRIRRGK